MPIEFAIGRQRARITHIKSRGGVGTLRDRDRLRTGATLLPQRPFALMTEVMLQRSEQIATKTAATGLGAAEIRRFEQSLKKLVSRLPGSLAVASIPPEEGDDRFVIGGAEFI